MPLQLVASCPSIVPYPVASAIQASRRISSPSTGEWRRYKNGRFIVHADQITPGQVAPPPTVCAWVDTGRTRNNRDRMFTSSVPHGLPTVVPVWKNASDTMDMNDVESTLKFRDWFVPAFKKAKTCIVLDVGANDGSWTRKLQRFLNTPEVQKSLNAQFPGAQTEFHLFEPQPRFIQSLRKVAAGSRWRTHLNHVAAWHEDTNLTFFLSRSSVSASLKPLNAYHSGVPRRGPPNITVRAIDLAGYMNRVLPSIPQATETLAVLKLDIESAEFEMLPYLIATGALCRVHLLLIEWHLNALPPAARLSGLGLRLTLSSMLRQGCAALNKDAIWTDGLVGPQMIHEGAPVNNYEQIVPGLWEVALYHNGTPVPGQTPSRLVKQWENMRLAIEHGTHLKSNPPVDLPPGVLPGRR